MEICFAKSLWASQTKRESARGAASVRYRIAIDCSLQRGAMIGLAMYSAPMGAGKVVHSESKSPDDWSFKDAIHGSQAGDVAQAACTWTQGRLRPAAWHEVGSCEVKGLSSRPSSRDRPRIQRNPIGQPCHVEPRVGDGERNTTSRFSDSKT